MMVGGGGLVGVFINVDVGLSVSAVSVWLTTSVTAWPPHPATSSASTATSKLPRIGIVAGVTPPKTPQTDYSQKISQSE